MSTGLQVFGPNGQIYVDMTVRFSQHQGSVRTSGANGSIVIPELPPGRQRFYYIVPRQDTQQWRGKFPGVTVTSNTMNWQYQHSTWFGQFSIDCEIYYGFY